MRRVYRSDTDKVIAGVCGGLGAYVGIDPLILRIAFVVLAMTSGVGLTLYVLLWLFVPCCDSAFGEREHVVRQNIVDMRDRARELGQEAREAFSDWRDESLNPKRVMTAGAILVGVGALVLLRNVGLLPFIGKMWPLVLIALGVVMLLNNVRGR